MEKQEKHKSKVTEPSAALRVQTAARTRVAPSPQTEPTPAISNDEDFAAALKGRRGIGPVELMCRIDEIRHLLLVCDGDVAKEQALCELLGVKELESLRLVLTIQALKAVYKGDNSKEENSTEQNAKEEKSKNEKSKGGKSS